MEIDFGREFKRRLKELMMVVLLEIEIKLMEVVL